MKNNQKGSLDLLIVEDNPGYLNVAQGACKELQEKIKFNVKYCKNFETAIKEIDTNKYNRCVTDLFKGDYAAKGLKIYLKCIKKNIPVGILTSGDRHADSLGDLRDYLDGKDHLDSLIERRESIVKWYDGKRLVEAARVDSKELFKVFLEKNKEQIKYDHGKRIKGKSKVFIKRIEKQLQEDLKKDSVYDPLYLLEGFVIGHNGTNKLDKKNWIIAIQRILEDKKDHFFWKED